MNITKEQVKKHLSNLTDNLLDSEETNYSEHFNIDYEQVDLTATEDLQEHNYKDLRVLQDYLNQDDYHEKAKDILWEYISDKDLPVIEQRLSDIEQVFDENDFTLVKSITQGENLFEHKNGCLYIVEYEEVDDEEIHNFDNPTLYMDKDGNKTF